MQKLHTLMIGAASAAALLVASVALSTAANAQASNAPAMTYPQSGGYVVPLPTGPIVGKGTYVGDGWAVSGNGATDLNGHYSVGAGIYIGPTAPTIITETGPGAPQLTPMMPMEQPAPIDPGPVFPELQPPSGPLFDPAPVVPDVQMVPDLPVVPDLPLVPSDPGWVDPIQPFPELQPPSGPLFDPAPEPAFDPAPEQMFEESSLF